MEKKIDEILNIIPNMKYRIIYEEENIISISAAFEGIIWLDQLSYVEKELYKVITSYNKDINVVNTNCDFSIQAIVFNFGKIINWLWKS